MILWGLAGHIDHGKTSLVRALTGIDTDRLPEEKKRGMTTDLGFASMQLGNGKKIGLLDVPGHEQYVSHVVEGLYGCDAALLVVAADDGWMPQAEEHFQIIRLLGIKNLLVALNKDDIVSAEELNEKTEEIRTILEMYGYDDIPIVPVSGKTNAGISELAARLEKISANLKDRPDIGNPRLSCDRVFSVHGSGIIVTGTVQHGSFKTGDEIIVWPGRKKGRIRKIERFGEDCSYVVPGDRAGINISGIHAEDIQRGSLITLMNPPESDVVDIMVKMLPGEPLRSRSDIRAYFETKSILGRLIVLDDAKEADGYVPAQLVLNESVSSYIGEKCILRDTSKHATIGGAFVLRNCAGKARKADRKALSEKMCEMLPLEPRRIVMAEIMMNGSLSTDSYPWTCFPKEQLSEAVSSLIKEGILVKLGEKIVQAKVLSDAEEKIKAYLKETEKAIPHATIKSALQMDDSVFEYVLNKLISKKEIESDDKDVRRAGAKEDISPEKTAMAVKIKKVLSEASAPVLLADIVSKIPGSKDVVYYLRNHGEVVDLPDTFFVDKAKFEEMVKFVREKISRDGQLSIQDLTTKFSLSRRPAVAVLTKLDQLFITQRRDNARVAGRAFFANKKRLKC